MKRSFLALCISFVACVALEAQSPVQQTIANNDLKGLNKWIKSTENLDAPFSVGDQAYTPLQYACEQANVEMALLLINKGANVNGLTQSQDALMFAAKGGNREIIEALLAKGANPLNENKTGYTARDLAKLAGHTDVANMLQTEIEARLAAMRSKRK